MLVSKFFENTLGRWESHRTYMYPKSNKITTLTTFFEWVNPEDNVYKVNWNSSEGQGSMEILLSNDKEFHRNIGYFTKDCTTSIILDVSTLYLFTRTSYNNMIFKEKITFLDHAHRTRQTVGYKNDNGREGDVILSGSYQEFKV
jgi:hypothetical protein